MSGPAGMYYLRRWPEQGCSDPTPHAPSNRPLMAMKRRGAAGWQGQKSSTHVCYSHASIKSETLILTFKPNDKVLYTSRQTQRLNGEKHCLAYLTPWACWGRFCPPWGLQLCSLHAVLSLHLNLCFWQLLLNLHQLQLCKHQCWCLKMLLVFGYAPLDEDRRICLRRHF